MQTHEMNIKEIDMKMEIQTQKLNNKDPSSNNGKEGDVKKYTGITHNIKATGRRLLTL